MENESIYNLIQKENCIEKKSLLNKGGLNNQKQQHVIGSTFGCTGTTRVIGAGKISKKKFGVFGPQTIQFSEEEDSNNPALLLDDERTGQSYRVESRLPKVPSKQEAPIFGLKSHKNFIKLNAVEAILNAPQKQATEPKDYLRKEDYGKVPAYLKEIARELEKEREILKQFVADTYSDGTQKSETLEELSDTERASLLVSLKSRWEELNCEYQKMAHLVELDTLRKKKRKEELEKELDTVEKDIFRLETAKKILIKL